jgi:hypothetical protein
MVEKIFVYIKHCAGQSRMLNHSHSFQSYLAGYRKQQKAFHHSLSTRVSKANLAVLIMMDTGNDSTLTPWYTSEHSMVSDRRLDTLPLRGYDLTSAVSIDYTTRLGVATSSTTPMLWPPTHVMVIERRPALAISLDGMNHVAMVVRPRLGGG